MRKLITGLAVALVVPSLALAAKPSDPGKSKGKSAPKVLYILKGTLSGYTAASATTPGTISILVKQANRHGAALKSLGSPLVFTVTAATKVKIGQGRTAIGDGDRGVVKIRAPKAARTTAAADLATLLQGQPAALQVLDQKAASS